MKSAVSLVILILVLFSCSTKEEISRKKEIVENYAKSFMQTYFWRAHATCFVIGERK